MCMLKRNQIRFSVHKIIVVNVFRCEYIISCMVGC